ncbi:PREDICTED: protein ABHD11-like [Branchiostoma belcheri]|uniref:sn-1-specific diacylglycerol lipase ABHD11 n=1 Tax=Branchiostoma belcheri TaxID=7741 RepID=A0A6P4XK79_BRABE|nr:PREDICTED: protein ABHD11-like [Branchiostoma belcheri]
MEVSYRQAAVFLRHAALLSRTVRPTRCLCNNRSVSTVKLACDTYGKRPDGNSSPLVILHGLFGSKQNWHSISRLLTRKVDRKIIAIDIRNHGESEHTDVMDYPSMAADVAATMKEEGVERGILIGHSMGGKIAMTLALQQAELVEKLIVVDTTPTTSAGKQVFPKIIEGMKNVKFHTEWTLSKTRSEADKTLLKTIPDLGVRQFILTNLVEDDNGWFSWRVNIDAIEKNLEQIWSFPQFKHVSYHGDTLFLGGSKSPYISESSYPEIKRLFPKALVTHIEDSGHWVHSEKPKEFMEAVTDFIRK